MPAFVLNTGNAQSAFDKLDTFTQAYVECMFFTDTGYEENGELEKATFADLSKSGLATIIADCAKFQAICATDLSEMPGDLSQAGHDFWYDRNGHGVGFTDRGSDQYTAEQAERFEQVARSFGEVCSLEYFDEIAADRMTPQEAWEYAAQWGSFMNNGDSGACMYGFDERFQVQSEQHRTDCLAWIENCRANVTAKPENYDDDEMHQLARLETAVRNAGCEAVAA